jgi:hypothetical protein
MANSYLNRTPSSTGNRRKFTFSFWIKKSANGTSETIYNVRPDSNGANRISWHSTDTLRIAFEPISKYIFTTRKFRDLSAWYHIVIAVDTEQATAANRVKLYVNGEQEGSLIKGDGSAATYPDQNADLDINTQNVINIGRDLETSSNFLNGYISHFSFVDGLQLTPTSFGETNSTSGIWKFKAPSGVTWGTNGFHLKFENSGALGTDSSGNTNTFTVNGNLKQSIDTPSNNYCTLNPNDVIRQSGGIYKPTFSNANLTMSSSSNHNYQTFGTFSPETGKWYWEMKIDTAPTTGHRLGVFFGNDKTHSGSYYYGTNAFYIHQNGEIYYNGSSTTYMSSYTAGDIISVALDITNGNLYFSKNGGANDSTWADGSGNNNQAFPGTSVNGKLSASWISGPVTPFFDVYGNGCKQSINFGNGLFGTTAISSAGSNGNNSLFEYDVPSGYYALNTKNINTYG